MKPIDVRDDVVFDVCKMFMDGDGATKIAKWLGDHGHHDLTREQVYPILREGRRRGCLTLKSPRERTIGRRIADVYKHPVESIHVIDARGDQTLEHLALGAADHALTLIAKYTRAGKQKVHIGFAAGATTMRTAQCLASRVCTENGMPATLGVHALTPGFSVRQPQISPISFFGYFDDPRIDLQCYGLHASPMVPTEDYENVKTLHGVLESFEAKEKIDLIITSFGSAQHEHGDLQDFLTKGAPEGLRALRKKQWLGDVLYRPFNAEGPVEVDTGLRALVLYELDELREMAQQDGKHIMLVAGPCARDGCGASRAGALRALLENHDLKVWNHLVIDVRTALELLPDD